ncbi:MAG: phosphatidate cytidylyltransferase, partial [Oscillospiraceae bacterium]|nr:phosphatidate cytidylyltransferase [Oscillospiraceae bacterium]
WRSEIMARRLITAGIAAAIGIAILAIDMKEIFSLAITAVSVAIVYEILVATKYINNRAVAIVSLLFVAVVTLVLSYDTKFFNTRYIAFAFIIGLFVIMLFSHKKVRFAEVALVSFVSLCVPISMSCIVFIYDSFPEHRTFALVYAMTITWISDSGAFFAGTFLGKHKMAPNISPKKTWEGFAGGILTAVLFGYLLGQGYEWVTVLFGKELTFNVEVLYLSILAVPCAVLGVLGDFSASILKRECAVKDFGSIMPGHGGILDRFDSLLFALPFVYLVFIYDGGRFFPVKDILNVITT